MSDLAFLSSDEEDNNVVVDEVPEENSDEEHDDESIDKPFKIQLLRCIVAGCSLKPTYGDPLDGKKLYCVSHKRPYDIDMDKCHKGLKAK